MKLQSLPADYQKAYRRTSRGRTTGPTSRILSWTSLMILATMLAIFLLQHLYIPVVAILALALTPIAPLAILGSFIYFIIIGYWLGIAFIVVYGVVGWSSVRAGIRFNSKRLVGELASVDPIEGMPELRTALIIQLPALVVGILAGGILSVLAWSVFALGTLFILSRYYFRLRPRWATLHYPLMLRYSAFAGAEMARATLEGHHYSMQANLRELIASAYPSFSQADVDQFLAFATEKLDSFADERTYKDHILVSNPGASEERREAILSKLRVDIIGQKRDAAILRYVIAEIIKRDLGANERTAYITELASGRAS